jgi:acyl dehydratase
MPTKAMDELEALVGETFQVVDRFPIEAGKIAEFAEATKGDRPLYLDTTGDTARSEGFDDVPAPPTFTMASIFFRDRQDVPGKPDLGFDKSRTLHGEEQYEFKRIPVAGDVLTGVGELTDVYQREGSRGGMMTFANWKTTFRDQREETVIVKERTVIEVSE